VSTASLLMSLSFLSAVGLHMGIRTQLAGVRLFNNIIRHKVEIKLLQNVPPCPFVVLLLKCCTRHREEGNPEEQSRFHHGRSDPAGDESLGKKQSARWKEAVGLRLAKCKCQVTLDKSVIKI